MRMTIAEEIEYLRAQVAEQREIIAKLTSEDDLADLQDLFGLSVSQSRVVALLMSKPDKWIDRETMWRIVCQRADGDGPTIETLRQTALYARRKMQDVGAPGRIEGRMGPYQGGGHRMTAPMAEWIRGRIDERRAA